MIIRFVNRLWKFVKSILVKRRQGDWRTPSTTRTTDIGMSVPKNDEISLTSYLFKVARGLAFASSHLVEKEPRLGVSFDKQKCKKTFFVFSKRKIHSLFHFLIYSLTF